MNSKTRSLHVYCSYKSTVFQHLKQTLIMPNDVKLKMWLGIFYWHSKMFVEINRRNNEFWRCIDDWDCLISIQIDSSITDYQLEEISITIMLFSFYLIAKITIYINKTLILSIHSLKIYQNGCNKHYNTMIHVCGVIYSCNNFPTEIS